MRNRKARDSMNCQLRNGETRREQARTKNLSQVSRLAPAFPTTIHRPPVEHLTTFGPLDCRRHWSSHTTKHGIGLDSHKRRRLFHSKPCHDSESMLAYGNPYASSRFQKKHRRPSTNQHSALDNHRFSRSRTETTLLVTLSS